ncbi:hypothetical protein Lesp02_16980 [Lentzea sp. NBRC 105346]|nr:hypothetical protein Lesp02_16980 [Lentzea sp. NBRC 105346]
MAAPRTARPQPTGWQPPASPPRPQLTRWQPAPPAPKPRTIKASTWLWIGAVALQILTTALVLLGAGELKTELMAQVAQAFPGQSLGNRTRVVYAALLLLLGSGVLISLLELALVPSVRKRWARISLVLLAFFGTLHALLVFGSLSSPFLAGLLVSASVAVGAVVMMYLPASRAWFSGGRR